MRLAVTGITSGIGMRLAELSLARGDSIAALVRDPSRSDARSLEARGVRLVRGDLENEAALREVARGAEAMIHLAAQVGDSGPVELFERVNVGGTRHAIEAAAAEGVPRFVHMSSTAVYGRPERGRVTEDWPTQIIGVPYDDTKVAAERLAFARGRDLGIAVVAVRPPVIYGEHDRNFLPRAMAALRGKRFLMVYGGQRPLNVVWVDHVVDVALRAADRATEPDVRGQAFNVMDAVDQRPPSVREVAETIARETGLPPPRLSVPYPVAMGIAYVVERAFKLAGRKEAPPISPFVVKLLSLDVTYDASKAARVLGWKPQITPLEGIARFARLAARQAST